MVYHVQVVGPEEAQLLNAQMHTPVSLPVLRGGAEGLVVQLAHKKLLQAFLRVLPGGLERRREGGVKKNLWEAYV